MNLLPEERIKILFDSQAEQSGLLKKIDKKPDTNKS
jgi:hypothetical protein